MCSIAIAAGHKVLQPGGELLLMQLLLLTAPDITANLPPAGNEQVEVGVF